MKDLLLNIEGLSFENLTTEVLRIILSQPGFEIYQKLFYNYIFENAANKSTREYTFDIVTQKRYNDGQPDIIILSKAEVIIIENKFYAKFTGDNQITRYQKILMQEFNRAFKKTIFLLTLKRQERYYDDLLKNELGEDYMENMDVSIKFIYWDDIVKLFKSNNFLTEALEGYLNNYYLTEIKFSEPEFAMLDSKLIPETLHKLFGTIDHIKAELANCEFEIENYRASQDYHGFYIKKGNLKIWFGSALNWWRELNEEPTPLFLQLREDWNPTVTFNEIFHDFLRGMSFKNHEEFQWIKSYPASIIKSDHSKLVKIISEDFSAIVENVVIMNSK